MGTPEQKVDDQLKRMRAYYRERRHEYRALVDGPQGSHWRELASLLRSMTMESGSELVAYVGDARWLLDADLHTRQLALGAIDDVIVKLRQVNGYAPFDDSLPGEKPTAFEVIRRMLRVT